MHKEIATCMRNRGWVFRFRNSGYCMRYDTSSVKIRLSTCCVDGSGAADTNCTNDPPPPKHLPTCVWEVTEAGESRSRQRYAAGSRRKSAPFRRCVSFLQKTVCPSPVQREPETIFEYEYRNYEGCGHLHHTSSTTAPSTHR